MTEPHGSSIPAAIESPTLIPVDTVVAGDSITLLPALPADSIHLIASDIPYGIGIDDWDVLHANTNSAYLGASPAQQKAGSVFRKRGKPLNGWSEADRQIPHEYYAWCQTWAAEWLRVLKPGSSALVFAGRRFQHRCVAALEDAGFTFKDMIGWIRPRAPHRAQRVSVVFERRGEHEDAATWSGWRVGNLRPRFEPILWFVKPYRIGTTIADNLQANHVGAYNEAGFLGYANKPDNLLEIGFARDEGGLHPTQKPVRLMEALITLASQPNQVVLDPFAGSGSTLVAAQNLNRRFVGYELNPSFVEIANRRLAFPQTTLGLTALEIAE
jgi:site-specific DNA-methyltransferase (adenine-specific)